MFKSQRGFTSEVLIVVLILSVVVFSAVHFLKLMFYDSKTTAAEVNIVSPLAPPADDEVIIEEEPVPLSPFAEIPDYEVPAVPSLLLEKAVNTSKSVWSRAGADFLTDNCGNTYSSAMTISPSGVFKVMLNNEYTLFKGTIYVAKGYYLGNTGTVMIELNGKVVYSSETITKSSQPINLNIDITDCEEFKITYKGTSSTDNMVFFGDCAFY